MATAPVTPQMERVRRQALQLRDQIVSRTNESQRKWMLRAGLAAAAIMAAVLLWSTHVEYRQLYSGLEAREAQQAAAELAAAKIPYELDATGTALRVPVEAVDKARLALAAKGMPQSGRMGFELFDKPNWMGSEFDERVNYQRALEGELEHTISTLGAIESARVHLVLPKESLFANEAQEAKASVIVRLNRRGLSDAQADSIRNLVAGSVEGLQAAHVSLVDADGRNTFRTSGDAAMSVAAEQAIEDRVMATLEPIAGRENLRVSVNLDYDNSRIDETQDSYDPKASVAVETHKSESVSGSATRAAGVPGTASNAPNTSPAAAAGQPAAPLPVFPQAAGGNENTREESNTFAASHSTRHTEQGPGRLRRMTVAVLVNDRQVTSGLPKALKTEWKHRTPEELKHLEELARDAAGFDAARGDQLAVEDVQFLEEPPAAVPTWMDKVRSQPVSVLPWLRTGAPVLVLIAMYFIVLRPVSRRLRTAIGTTESVVAQQALATGGADNESAPALAGAGDAAAQAAFAQPVVVERLLPSVTAETLGREVRVDPDNATRMLRSWLAAPHPQAAGR